MCAWTQSPRRRGWGSGGRATTSINLISSAKLQCPCTRVPGYPGTPDLPFLPRVHVYQGTR
eukprot:965112-Rhodomonas_salina.1